MDGLIPFEKNFYVESPEVEKMSEVEVEEYRKRREITVEGRDVPKPIKSFRDTGFPGTFYFFVQQIYNYVLRCHIDLGWVQVIKVPIFSPS